MTNEWTVELQGDSEDLREWAGELRPPFKPSVTLTDVSNKVSEERKIYLLKATEFEECQGAACVWERALPILRQLNALMAISRYSGPISMGRVFHRDEAGVYRGSVFVSSVTMAARFRVNANMVVMRNGKVVTELPKPSFVQHAWEHKDEAINDALEHFSRADNWHDLYKAYEALGKEAGLRKLGFKDADIGNFSRTANLTRHHKSSANPPRRLTLEEGRDFIADACRRRLAGAR